MIRNRKQRQRVTRRIMKLMPFCKQIHGDRGKLHTSTPRQQKQMDFFTDTYDRRNHKVLYLISPFCHLHLDVHDAVEGRFTCTSIVTFASSLARAYPVRRSAAAYLSSPPPTEQAPEEVVDGFLGHRGKLLALPCDPIPVPSKRMIPMMRLLETLQFQLEVRHFHLG